MDKNTFINYNKTYEEEIDIWIKTHNIVREKSELYYEFFVSLFDLMIDTYLGQDVLMNEKDMKNHYDWCFNKTVSNFQFENIYFNHYGEHHEYLWYFFMTAFYNTPTESRTRLIYEYIGILFDFKREKTQYELEGYLYLYKIFNKNLKRTK